MRQINIFYKSIEVSIDQKCPIKNMIFGKIMSLRLKRPEIIHRCLTCTNVAMLPISKERNEVRNWEETETMWQGRIGLMEFCIVN